MRQTRQTLYFYNFWNISFLRAERERERAGVLLSPPALDVRLMTALQVLQVLQRGREIGFSRQWRQTQKQRATVLGAGGAPDATGLNPSRRRLRPGPRPARRQIFSPIPRARPPPRRLRERRFDTLQPRAAAPRHTASRAALRCSDRARGSARHGAVRSRLKSQVSSGRATRTRTRTTRTTRRT